MARRPGPPTFGKRFVGNVNTTEVHDVDNEMTGANQCRIDEVIATGNAVTFKPDTLEQSHLEKFDNCHWCIGGSKR